MKALVFLLVAANLLFFAFAKGYFGRPENPDAGRSEQQLHPEQIRVIARGEPPGAKGAAKVAEKETAPVDKEAAPAAPEAAAGKPASPEKPAASEKPAAPEKAAAAEKAPDRVAGEKPAPAGPEACLVWGELSAGEANRLAALVEGKFSEFKVERRATPGEGSSWWVYIPPLPGKADAERKAIELKRMGVTDYFIVQEAGPNRFAISLGVFTNESGANDQLASLKAKGVRSARIGPRVGKDALHAVEVRGPAARQGALAAAAGSLLPDISSRKCK